MQTNSFLRTLAAVAAVGFLVACSNADNPYAAIKDPPLLKATLHTVTIEVADSAAIDLRVKQGYTRLPPAPNYPGSVRVEAALWKVSEAVAAAPVVLTSPGGVAPNERYLVMAPTDTGSPVADPDANFVGDFYQRVLGDMPSSYSEIDKRRIHSKTYLVDDILAAKKKLQEAGIPITFSPVAITTAYYGDHKLLGITAPDGVIIELVETAAQ